MPAPHPADPHSLAALDATALLAEQQRLRALVYSRQAEAEPARQHLDSSTGQFVQLRESEWRLLQLQRELQRRAQADSTPDAGARTRGTDHSKQQTIPDAAAAASAPAQPQVPTVSLPRVPASADAAASTPPPPPPAVGTPPYAASPPAHTRTRWLRAALLFVGGVAVGTGATLSATGVVQVPGFSAFAPAPVSSPEDAAPLRIPVEHAALLQIFTNGEARAEPVPAVLEKIFPPDGIALIYAPDAGNTGSRIYAARPDLQQLCLIAAIPTQQLAWRCSSIADVTRSGLHLRFWLASGLQQPPSTLSEYEQTPTIADAAWNPDGTFSVSETPYG